MSACANVTERDVVLRERAAFTDGATFELRAWQKMQRVDYCSGADSIAEGQRRYPFPKVTRPRVVADSKGVQWRILPDLGDQLQFRVSGDCVWYAMLHNRYGSDFKPIPERIKLWADLLANPTETVDA